MTTIVVGGHSRKVGKTSVAAGIIAAFPRCSWTAVKITSHLHGELPESSACRIQEETDRAGHSDTSRFLAAGAARALWVRARGSGYGQAVRELLAAIQSDPFVIIESNRILQFIRPDLYLLVLRYGVEEFKDSARETLLQAHAIVAVKDDAARADWKGIELPDGVPVFEVHDLTSLPKDLIDWLSSHVSFPVSRSPFPVGR